MKKKKVFASEQIIEKLREAMVLLGLGSTVDEVSRKLGITEQTHYRRRLLITEGCRWQVPQTDSLSGSCN